ncbi:glycoside hydrolase family 26 protein [Haloimpatiens sp. FM7330]|uniref:glycoside hydrolase family 26 protein n=1 Tax=Haloimpatiens sp. FM7330 TaxID=3298610 RepID=UPI0036457663
MGKNFKILFCVFCITILSSMRIALAQTPVTYNALWTDESKDITLNPNISSIQNYGDKNKYINSRYGYSFNYPKTWNLDKHRDTDYVRMYGSDFRIDIFYDDIFSKFKNYGDYIDNVLKSVNKNVYYKQRITINNLPVANYDYSRKKINGIKNDLNKYSYFFVINKNKVYTIQLKTNDKKFSVLKNQVKKLIASMKFTNTNLTDLNKNIDTSKYSPEIKYTFEKNTLHIPKNKVTYGTFNGYPSVKIYDVEKSLDTHLGSQMIYFSVASNYQSYIKQVVEDGRAPVITLHLQNKQEDKEVSIVKLINGDYDKYLSSWANGVKSIQAPIFIRFCNEMNGEWTGWSCRYTYNDPDLYKIGYRYLVDYFRKSGCKNTYFVWNPTSKNIPNCSFNKESVYYPGSKYVDWVGLTAYNFGNIDGNKFKSFDELYSNLYKSYLRDFPNKPMMIGEFSSVEQGGSKAAFIQDVFKKIPKRYPNIKLVIWFNYADGKYDFRINSSKNSQEAFKQALKDSSVITHPMISTLLGKGLIFPNRTVVTEDSLWKFSGKVLDQQIKSISLNNTKFIFKSNPFVRFEQMFRIKQGNNIINMEVQYKNGTNIKVPITVRKSSALN